MKANELRIGNKILYNIDTEGLSWEVLTVTWEDIKECLEDSKEFNEKHKPILLTEEWLLRFGFVKLDFFYILESEINLKISLNLKMVAWHNLQLYNVKIKHVHQLQNLYFALNNKEL